MYVCCVCMCVLCVWMCVCCVRCVCVCVCACVSLDPCYSLCQQQDYKGRDEADRYKFTRINSIVTRTKLDLTAHHLARRACYLPRPWNSRPHCHQPVQESRWLCPHRVLLRAVELLPADNNKIHLHVVVHCTYCGTKDSVCSLDPLLSESSCWYRYSGRGMGIQRIVRARARSWTS